MQQLLSLPPPPHHPLKTLLGCPHMLTSASPSKEQLAAWLPLVSRAHPINRGCNLHPPPVNRGPGALSIESLELHPHAYIRLPSLGGQLLNFPGRSLEEPACA